MRKIIILIFIMSQVFAVSCMDMYNDVADELGAEYDYFLASTDTVVDNVKTYPLSTDGMPDFSIVKSSSVVNNPYYPAVDPTGNFLYVPSSTDNLLYTFKVNDDGSLTSLGSIATGTFPHTVKVHPSGNYVYVINNNVASQNMFAYQVNSDGTLIYKSTHSLGVGPRGLTIDPAGNCLYVISGTVGGSVINSIKITNGTVLSDINYSTGSSNKTDLIIHPNKKYLYVSRDGGFDKYDLLADGSIDSANIVSVNGLGNSGYLAIHPSGNFLYYIGIDGNMRSYKINNDGTVSANNQINLAAGFTVYDLIIHPKGKYLYASTNDPRLYCITINDDGKVNSSSYTDVTSIGLALIRKKK